MIDQHHDAAVESGARIVPSCGFDCIPVDLGVYFVQEQMRVNGSVMASWLRTLLRVRIKRSSRYWNQQLNKRMAIS